MYYDANVGIWRSGLGETIDPNASSSNQSSIGSQVAEGLTALFGGVTSLAKQQSAADLAQQQLAAQTALQQAALAKGIYVPPTTAVATPAGVSGASTGLIVVGLLAAGVAAYMLWKK